MFAWFKKQPAQPPATEAAALNAASESGTAAAIAEPLAVFGLPAERDIFPYHDGHRDRRIDPLVAWDRYITFPNFDPKSEFEAADEGDSTAIARVVALVCTMFDVKEYDGQTGEGLTRDEMQKLLGAFMTYFATLKKKLGASLITLPPMALESFLMGSPESPTQSDAASCSTPSEANAEPPTTS